MGIFGQVSCSTFSGALLVTPNTVQKLAGKLRVPSAAPRKAKLFERYGTWNVPATTVLNRPLRPRAEGEQDWQPEKRSL